jgi:hypothetical protein
VSERRALLTDREREIIAGDADVADSYRYQTISRVRARFDRLEGDLQALEEHGELADEFRGIVCRTGADQSPPASARESATEGAGVSGEESAGGGSTSQPPGDGESRSEGAHGGESDTGEREPLDDALAELPSTVDPDAARDAIHAAREFLEKRGRATKADFVRGVMRDQPLGYDPDAALAKLEAGERFRGAWWRKVVKPGLEAFDDVEKPPRGASDWKLADSERDE